MNLSKLSMSALVLVGMIATSAQATTATRGMRETLRAAEGVTKGAETAAGLRAGAGGLSVQLLRGPIAIEKLKAYMEQDDTLRAIDQYTDQLEARGVIDSDSNRVFDESAVRGIFQKKALVRCLEGLTDEGVRKMGVIAGPVLNGFRDAAVTIVSANSRHISAGRDDIKDGLTKVRPQGSAQVDDALVNQFIPECAFSGRFIGVR